MKNASWALPVILAALLGLAFQPRIEAGEGSSNWPGWRGPGGNGISPEADLPVEWSDTKNVLWKTPIPGRGHSSPIVWGNRVFLTTAIEGAATEDYKRTKHFINGEEFVHPDGVAADRINTLKVYALDRDTGKVVWERTPYEGTIFDSRHRRNTRASETPVTDGRRVYAYFGSAGLYAYDFEGKLQWKFSPGDIGTYGVGTGTSPILYGDLVILQVDNEDGTDSVIVALDTSNGKVRWKKQREVQVSWATPLLVPVAGGTQLITSGNEFIVSYDPANGEELWRVPGLESNAIPSPVAGHGLVVVSAGFPAKRVKALRIISREDQEREVWSYNKGTGYIPSPILHGDYVYLISDGGILTCLDARTGDVVYEGGRVPIPARFASSIVAFGGKLLLSSQDGDSFVIQAGPEHKVISTNSINEPIWATPAIADGKIFIRGEHTLFAIAKTAEEE